MLRKALYIALILLTFSGTSQVKQFKKYYNEDSTKLKEVFHYSIEDSVLQGSYELFFFNGSLQTFGSYHQNEPDSIWKYYYENGRLKATGSYKKGKPRGKWKYFYENGNIKSEGILDGSEKNGYWVFYYENGGEKSNGNYFSNLKSGIWNYLYEDGSIKAQSYLEGGKGRYTEFYPSGKRRMEGFNEYDKSTGEWIYYYESGEIEAIGSFKEGLKDDTWTYYHKNGLVAAEGEYKDGHREGNWKYYHDNGNVSQEGLVIKDQKDGYWKLFYPDGELLGDAEFDNGSGNFNEYYPSGSRKSKGQLLNGVKTGKWFYYSENGVLEGEASFHNGIGDYIGYYPDGTPKMQGQLKDEKRVGEWTLFNPDGSLAGSYHPIYEDEKPIFKTRISSDEKERVDFSTPEYRFKRRGFKYFQPTINEYRGIIFATNPAWLLVDELPVAVEYYIQERLGYELQVDLLREPFFTPESDIDIYTKYARGTQFHLRQKFYNPDGINGMFYFGHQLTFKYLNHQVNHLDTLIIQPPIRHGSLIEKGYGYGIFIGTRWMKDAGDAGFTFDIFLGLDIVARSYSKQYESNQALDNYFNNEIKSTLHFPIQLGLNIGLAAPKNKSKTQ